MEKPPESSIQPERVKREWKSRGFSFGVFTDPPGQVWKDFIHETDELIMLVRGRMSLEMGGQTLDCTRGKEILIPAGTEHSVRNTGSTDSVWFYGYKQPD